MYVQALAAVGIIAMKMSKNRPVLPVHSVSVHFLSSKYTNTKLTQVLSHDLVEFSLYTLSLGIVFIEFF